MNDLYNNLEIVIEPVVRAVLYHFMYLPALAVALVSILLESSVPPEEGTCWHCLSSCPAGLALKGGFRIMF